MFRLALKTVVVWHLLHVTFCHASVCWVLCSASHLSVVCSFWKYVSTLDRQESRRYLEMLYHTKLRPLIANVPEAENQSTGKQ